SATAAGATLTLTPTSGGVGTTIQIKGTGFTSGGATSVITCWQSESGCGQSGNTGGTVIPLAADGSFTSIEDVTISSFCLSIAGTTEAQCTNPPNCTSCVFIAVDNGYPTHDTAQATFAYIKTPPVNAPTPTATVV